MNISLKKIKLAKMLSFIKEIPTDKGLIVIDGELEIGNEVFIYDEEGSPVPAPDGIYKTDDMEITIEGGKITEVKETKEEETPIVETEPVEEEVVVETEEEEKPVEEEVPVVVVEEQPTDEEMLDALKTRIAELEEAIKEKDEKIAELEAEVKKYQEKELQPEGEPAEEEIVIEDKFSKKERREKNVMKIVSHLS